MIIMGIDPGYAITGWCILNKNNDKITLIDNGAILTNKKNYYIRLMEISKRIEKIIKKYKPSQASIEKIFFNKNIKTAIDVAQVRGALALILLKQQIKIFDYTPLQVKQAIVGYGQATKLQVQKMVQLLLHLTKIPTPDDVADAMAIGLCHCHSLQMNELIRKSV